MEVFLGLIILCAVYTVVLLGGRYIIVAIAILLGHKDTIRDFGNLCEEDLYEKRLKELREFDREEYRWNRKDK